MQAYSPNTPRVVAKNGLKVRASSAAAMVMVGRQMIAPAATLAAPVGKDAEFRELHADVAAWLDANAGDNDFARSLRQSLGQYGRLTADQTDAVKRILARGDVVTKQQERAIEVSMIKVNEAIANAQASGLIRIHLRLGAFSFKPAKKYPGSVYVTTNTTADDGAGIYLGRITGGKLFPVADCTDEQREQIAKVASDPRAAAEAYGQQTGRCACCGLTLTDPESIARSIGPICAEKFSF